MAGFDMDNRDPNNLNEHLQVMWDDIIGEPEGIKSTQCAWNCSYKCFRGTTRCCYFLLTTLFAPCLAFCSAINFASLAFQHIWCMGPCLRTWKINCAFFRTVSTVLHVDRAQNRVVCILPRSKFDTNEFPIVMARKTS